MERSSSFSYTCNQCGLCCRDKVITLSPYDLMRIARAAGISTNEALRKYTLRRGSLLKFKDKGSCVALEGTTCTIHQGRPLACRLYPLGLQRTPDGAESFIRLEPAVGSLGVYGAKGTIADFLETQGFREYLDANEAYRKLIPLMRERIAALVDFATVEPREFERVAIREALAEANFDPNPLIDALFDPDGLGCSRASLDTTVAAHLAVLEAIIRAEGQPAILAAAAALLAVSLGYSPRSGG
ncbi:MAG TPA: YkgJ family cysteine cluster protein [Candidatus Binataceae bacterium]|nr:YkgJ family cysteine cluster protein [Candidatus Binataceae bacterium]